MSFGALSVKGRALRHLARREHSRAELERKLARHVEDEPGATARDRIAAALDELVAVGLLSESRAAASVLHTQSARFGSRRLRQTLQSRRIAPDLVRATLDEARPSEFDRAFDLWHRRFGTASADPREQARQTRFLIGRGFDGEVVRRVLRSCPPEAEVD